MGLVRSLERAYLGRSADGTPGVNRSPLSNFWYTPTGLMSSAGVRMSRDSAMTCSAFWSGVQKIAKSIASVPCTIYQYQDDGGKRTVRTNEPGIGRLAIDLTRQPNPSQTAFDFFFMLIVHVLTRGLSVSVIQDKAAGGYGQELIPLHPDRITAGKLPNGTMSYDYNAPNGTKETYLQDEVFAVWGMTVDGVTPMSVIQYGARSIGTALAADESAARFFASGMTSQFAVTYKDHVEPTTADTVSAHIAGRNAGLKNGHAPIILGDDPHIVADLGIKPQDAQLIDTRRFGIEEIARWLDIPKHMLKADQGTGSYASLEVFSAEFVTYTLLPWVVQIEQAIGRDLIIAPDKFFVEFNLNKLMRGNMLDRYRAHQVGIFTGFETRNEARIEEGRNPMDGLDKPLEPMNYQTVGDDMGPAHQTTPGAPPSAPGQPKQDQARARLESRLGLLHANIAARLVRREQHEIEKLAKKHASDAAAWAQAVPAFYAEFTTQIAEDLRIGKESAAEYAATHAMALVREGVPAMKDWDRDAAVALTERARRAIAA